MSYYYATEKARFEAGFKRFNEAASAASMREEDIQAMYETDLHQFNRDRAFIIHTQPIESGCFSNGDEADEDQSPLFKKHLEALSVPMEELFTGDRYGWMEHLTDKRFAEINSALSQKDIELLTYIAVDGLSQAEVARELGISRAAVSKRLKRIGEKLEKIHCAG